MRSIARIGVILLTLLLLCGCRSEKSEESDSSNIAIDKAPAATTTEPSVTVAPPFPTVTNGSVTTEPITPTTPANLADAAGYGAVYDEICLAMDTGDLSREYKYISDGLSEVVYYRRTPTERYNEIAFALAEMNHDSHMEMVVVDATDNCRILAVYTLDGNQPVLMRDGVSNAPLYWLSSGIFYKSGSAGATGPYFETDDQCWFVQPKSPEEPIPCFYYSPIKDYDPSTAQQITEEEYTVQQDAFTQMIVTFNTYRFD